MKSGISSLMKFAAGSALGVALGATIGLLMAPRSGEQLQADTAMFVDNLRTEGEQARAEAEAEMAARFRQKVGDPNAFTNNA